MKSNRHPRMPYQFLALSLKAMSYETTYERMPKLIDRLAPSEVDITRASELR